MFDITPQERRIVTFLVAALLLGCLVRLAQHLLIPPLPDISIVSPELPRQAGTDAPAPDPPDTGPPERIDINTADLGQLQSLSGIGPHLARRIIEYRRQQGPFSSPGDITSVPGIGEKTYLRLRDRITADSAEIRGTISEK